MHDREITDKDKERGRERESERTHFLYAGQGQEWRNKEDTLLLREMRTRK